MKKLSRDYGDGSGGKVPYVNKDGRLSSDPTPTQTVVCACNSSAGEVERGKSLKLTGQLALPGSVKRVCLKKQVDSNKAKQLMSTFDLYLTQS